MSINTEDFPGGSQPERRDLLRLQAGAKERRHRLKQAAALSGRAIHVSELEVRAASRSGVTVVRRGGAASGASQFFRLICEAH